MKILANIPLSFDTDSLRQSLDQTEKKTPKHIKTIK